MGNPPARHFAFICAVLALVVVAACDSRSDLSTARAQVRGGRSEPSYEAAVYVTHSGTVGCSGVVVAPRVVITAKHCYYPGEQYGIGTGTVGSSPIIVAREVMIFPHHLDIAALLFDADLPIVPASIGAATVGETLRYVGYGSSELVHGDHPRRSVPMQVESIVDWRVTLQSSPEGGLCYGDSGGAVFREGENVASAILSQFITPAPDRCVYGNTLLFVSLAANADVIARAIACASSSDPQCAAGGSAPLPPGGECVFSCSDFSYPQGVCRSPWRCDASDGCIRRVSPQTDCQCSIEAFSGYPSCDATAVHMQHAECVEGDCVFRDCIADWADCNAEKADGCETPLGTRFACGACGDRCAATEICRDNACRTGCDRDDACRTPPSACESVYGHCVDEHCQYDENGTCDREVEATPADESGQATGCTLALKGRGDDSLSPTMAFSFPLLLALYCRRRIRRAATPNRSFLLTVSVMFLFGCSQSGLDVSRVHVEPLGKLSAELESERVLGRELSWEPTKDQVVVTLHGVQGGDCASLTAGAQDSDGEIHIYYDVPPALERMCGASSSSIRITVDDVVRFHPRYFSVVVSKGLLGFNDNDIIDRLGTQMTDTPFAIRIAEVTQAELGPEGVKMTVRGRCGNAGLVLQYLGDRIFAAANVVGEPSCFDGSPDATITTPTMPIDPTQRPQLSRFIARDGDTLVTGALRVTQ